MKHILVKFVPEDLHFSQEQTREKIAKEISANIAKNLKFFKRIIYY